MIDVWYIANQDFDVLVYLNVINLLVDKISFMKYAYTYFQLLVDISIW